MKIMFLFVIVFPTEICEKEVDEYRPSNSTGSSVKHGKVKV